MNKSANTFCGLLLWVLLSSVIGMAGVSINTDPVGWFEIMGVVLLLNFVSYHRGLNRW
mgnify:CR=1 FL=1|jgi:hypothetical protein